MNIVIAGGTGFIGSKLTEMLLQSGHHIYILTRSTKNKNNRERVTYVQWLNDGDQPEEHLKQIDAVINLAGESLNSGRWTETRKKNILDSRIDATNEILNLIEKLETNPHVLVNASAIGYYGTSLTKTFTEDTTICGTDFLAHVVNQWEMVANHANDLGVRTVLVRFGVVLSTLGGALEKMVTPYKFFAGGTIGSGKQWLSWIHIDDAIRMILFALENDLIQGPLNVTAPNPVQMREMGKEISNVIGRPHWLPTPGIALKIILGEMSVLVLEGQYVLPKRAEEFGFTFDYPTLTQALTDLVRQ
ncbi:TIGR01777 family oxidoreductase [Anaerobacillus sp. MEB173]|uniref:TIGR01777 family oxidoreductase n=1 Tax=Anaerobacillus sp. MEB173 TaxID=3383345 RepID=UPI003F927067